MSDLEIGPAISVRDVEKSYRGVRVLVVPRLDLALGAHVTLRGSNGSGKSTLLRVMAGISPPSKGRVHSRPGKRIGYVPQSGGMSDALSVGENLDQRRRLCGLGPDAHRKDELLHRAGLASSRHKRFSELSGGLQRLAAIASALYIQPDWIFADEPFAGVDRHKRDEIENLLASYSAHAELTIVTSPETEEQFSFAPQTISLKDGRIDLS